MFRRIRKLVCLFLLACCIEADAKVTVRTTLWQSGNLYVAFDFGVSGYKKVNKESGSVSVIWQNAEVVDSKWTADSKSLIYKLKQSEPDKPIKYDLFYVICENACEPRSETGEIIPNALLSEAELAQVMGKTQNVPPFVQLLLWAFLGGLILNLMPCVFPIISLKIFSIAKIAGNSKSEIRRETGLFALGISTVFFALGILLNAIKSVIPNVGWGFYMQEPVFVFSLMLVFLACAMHFLGIYHFQFPRFSHKSKRTVGAFFSGLLSGITSSSCVGPFAGVSLATAILCNSGVKVYAILAALCLGASAPYIAMTMFPCLMHRMPKPGTWLNTFQNFMGYAMLASAAWILSIMISQIGNEKATRILLITIAIIFLLHQLGNAYKSKGWKYVSLTGILGFITLGYVQVTNNIAEQIKWEPYDLAKLENAAKANDIVFLNFTADWCLNCKYNEFIFKDADVVEIFNRHNVVAIKCDWTSRNEQITSLLKQYDAIAVPLYVLIKGGKTKILPNLLTKKSLIGAIEEIE